MPEVSKEVLSALRSCFSNLKIPSSADKVYKDECVYSFDSSFSDDGLYVNIISYLGFGKDYLEEDFKKTGCRVYLHFQYRQVLKSSKTYSESKMGDNSKEDKTVEPTKLAIGVEGGFMVDRAKYDILKKHSLVAILNGVEDMHFIPLQYQEKENGNPSSISCEFSNVPEFILNVAKAIIDHEGVRTNLGVNVWEASNELIVSKYAADLKQVNPNNIRIPQDPKLWRDEESGSTENLWLNLSTGYIGGGRKNWDGSGGSGSALNHFKYHRSTTGELYPLVVKLGTITPHGADVWSYAEDEDCMVTDPKLAEHLSFWGIDAMKMEKTDKTFSEMEVSMNLSYDWSKLLEGQEKLEPIYGPGYVGLSNIGSSCYMNSVLQAVLSLPEVQERYFYPHRRIVETSSNDPINDFPTQFSKVAVGVLSARYVPPVPTTATVASSTSASASGPGSSSIFAQDGDYVTVSKESLEEEEKKDSEQASATDFSELEKYVVAPRMFKYVVSKGHQEFSSGRQQDVSEYFMHLLEIMNKAERVHMRRLVDEPLNALPTASIFQFHLEDRIQCTLTSQVRYSKQGAQSLNNMIVLPIPLDKAVIVEEEEKARESEQESKKARVDALSSSSNQAAVVDQFVPFEECLQSFLKAETVDLFNPTVQQIVPCLKTTRFKTFPRYLMVKLSRYYVGPNWVQVKINARVDMPEFLDLSPYRATGLQRHLGEVEMPEEESNRGAAEETSVEADAEIVNQLMAMGFSENGCRRAALAVGNANAEAAMNWVFEHMEDPGFNDPIVPSLKPLVSNSNNVSETSTARSNTLGSVDPEVISMLTSMGYSEEQTRAALLATDFNIERAADWLFSHIDNIDAAVAEVLASQLGESVHSVGDSSISSSIDASIGKPTLRDCDDGNGQYSLVAIISHLGKNTDHGHYVCHVKKDNQWVLFNDDKVGKCKSPPLEHGFMYLYRRVDGSGTLLA